MGVPPTPPIIISPVVVIGLVRAPVHPLVVAPPLASVQRVAPVPETVPEVSRFASVPCSVAAMSWFDPFEASALAEVGTEAPLTFTTVVAKVPAVVTSPLRLPFVTEVAPEKEARFPAAGVPVVVTVPDPALIVLHPNPVPRVYIRAFDAPEHEGNVKPLGVVAVKAPRT